MARDGDLLEVTWADAVHTQGQVEAPDAPGSLMVRSVGYRVEETADRLVIAMSRNGESGVYHDALTLPQGVIRSVRVLAERGSHGGATTDG